MIFAGLKTYHITIFILPISTAVYKLTQSNSFELLDSYFSDFLICMLFKINIQLNDYLNIPYYCIAFWQRPDVICMDELQKPLSNTS